VLTGRPHAAQVSVSGVMKPHDYEPAARTHAMLRQSVDLGAKQGFRNGAVAAVLSDADSATVLVAPSCGGDVARWRVKERGGRLAFTGWLDRTALALGAI
jgi:hypothetical protein